MASIAVESGDGRLRLRLEGAGLLRVGWRGYHVHPCDFDGAGGRFGDAHYLANESSLARPVRPD